MHACLVLTHYPALGICGRLAFSRFSACKANELKEDDTKRVHIIGFGGRLKFLGVSRYYVLPDDHKLKKNIKMETEKKR
jgi:hypothetical protein